MVIDRYRLSQNKEHGYAEIYPAFLADELSDIIKGGVVTNVYEKIGPTMYFLQLSKSEIEWGCAHESTKSTGSILDGIGGCAEETLASVLSKHLIWLIRERMFQFYDVDYNIFFHEPQNIDSLKKIVYLDQRPSTSGYYLLAIPDKLNAEIVRYQVCQVFGDPMSQEYRPAYYHKDMEKYELMSEFSVPGSRWFGPINPSDYVDDTKRWPDPKHR